MARSKKSNSKHTSNEFMESLKTFVRTRGVDFLDDPNITSVGIGYKQKEGQRTNEIAVQFTVAEKAVPEALDDLDTTLIPPSFVIDGIEVPTDVLQRSYEPSFRPVVTEVSNPRKTRIDPIVPGVSIGHTAVTAGTIGCIVYDQQTGVPYILSNWHVLHGPDGAIGDSIVQPGPHDDNRIHQNRVGKLIRSHLGAAGDCAVATIEDRTFKSELLDLDVVVDQIGVAELDDKVIKSGRTTGVTYGIVTRVNVMSRIDYGGSVGEQDIGGFEIEPDEDHPSENGEISMGGDSGSGYVFRSANGRTSRVLGGLHFAGEASGNPHEYGLACYAHSVFEKLGITLLPPTIPAVTPTEALLRKGYEAEFLGPRIEVPTLFPSLLQKAFKRNNSEVIPYTHFSLALHEQRRFAIWVGWNVDGSRLRRENRNGIPFIVDPDIPAKFQVDDVLYNGNRLDRGHIARRADLCWGSEQESRQANRDSFFFTNITPQMDDFNQSRMDGIWGQLEDAVFAEVEVENLRVSVFGGPVFQEDDQVFRGIKIPREFYKVLAYIEAGALKARAFILTQNLEQLELLDLDQFRVFQVTLAEVEKRCHFRFAELLKAADGFVEVLEAQSESLEPRKPLETLGDIRW